MPTPVTGQDPDQLHPRPQLTRDRWVDLSGLWGFAHDDADAGLAEGWTTGAGPFTRTITVPFPPESPASGIGDRDYHPVVWYRRTFRNPARPGERLLLHVGAADYQASVWVNGQQVASHEGGHTPFAADVTAALHPGDAEQTVVVRVEDQPLDATQPRGKQDWEAEPHGIWYHRTTGIWQPVWLEPVAPTHLAEIRWTPDVARTSLGLRVRLNRWTAQSLTLKVTLSLAGEELASDTYRLGGDTLERDLTLAALGNGQARRRVLWSPDSPTLLDAQLTLLDGDTVIDEVASYAGLRSTGFGEGRFLLNGRPYFLRLVLEQGYWPTSHLAAPSPEALRREVELAKELGFNGVRIHQKVEDPRFLYWCDRLGLLVWGEMANAFEFSPRAVERLTREWLEVLRRDHSHPSVVTWVPVNESWGVPDLREDPRQAHYLAGLYHLTHAVDGTRPVLSNDGWEHVTSDLWTIHDYARKGATLRERYADRDAVTRTIREVVPGQHRILHDHTERDGQPVVVSEFGGISYAPKEGERWHGYGTVTDADGYLAAYTDLVGALTTSSEVAGFCYTQLTDTEQETNGLLTEDREHKLDPAAVRAVTTRPAGSRPTEEVAAHRAKLRQPAGGNGASR